MDLIRNVKKDDTSSFQLCQAEENFIKCGDILYYKSNDEFRIDCTNCTIKNIQDWKGFILHFQTCFLESKLKEIPDDSSADEYLDIESNINIDCNSDTEKTNELDLEKKLEGFSQKSSNQSEVLQQPLEEDDKFVCRKIFVKRLSLKKRLYLQPNDEHQKIFNCELCKKKFNLIESLQTHQRKSHSKDKTNSIVCEYCDMKFNINKAKRIHILHKHSEKISLNDQNTNNTSKLTAHKCNLCPKTYLDAYSLKVHYRTHTGEKPLKCEICGKCYARHSSLCSHRKTHILQEFICDQCDKKFKSKNGLERHKETHLISEDKSYQCQDCEKCFAIEGRLKIHRRMFHSKFKYVCDQCGKGYSVKPQLDRHLQKHTGYKPFKCETCDKCFYNNSGLKLHIRSHTGEKPYKCDNCEKCFSTSSILHVHRRRHAGIKPFNCKYCDKTFSTAILLNDHTCRHHTGENIHQCDICGQSLYSDHGLKRHKKMHLKILKCEKCSKNFSNVEHFKNHLKTHEDQKLETI